ncbi:hypothetical protein Nepgr_001699 [Nepenthes gracilis]|uniref:Uncharacterized protein n=1 Tax=Nepenthes gracilis TaxID=150966 RepID=A0AAD3P6H3_NEPGR|nr:hypothetical protein Nepgr_001699 [Nepenthes gracilis]
MCDQCWGSSLRQKQNSRATREKEWKGNCKMSFKKHATCLLDVNSNEKFEQILLADRGDSSQSASSRKGVPGITFVISQHYK